MLVGMTVGPLVPDSLSEHESGEDLASIGGGLGQGITLAVLGGYRNVAANLVWISMYGEWQYRREAVVLEKMELAVSLNSDSTYFWIDGSRIIANDMPVWQVGDDQMESLFNDPEGIEVRKQYGEQALAFLNSAPEPVGSRIPILLEKGTICWQRLSDLDRALGYFHAAVLNPEAPYFVSRVYAELLVKNGEKRRALEYLQSHYETLPDEEREAMKPFVARRIQELSRELE